MRPGRERRDRGVHSYPRHALGEKLLGGEQSRGATGRSRACSRGGSQESRADNLARCRSSRRRYNVSFASDTSHRLQRPLNGAGLHLWACEALPAIVIGLIRLRSPQAWSLVEASAPLVAGIEDADWFEVRSHISTLTVLTHNRTDLSLSFDCWSRCYRNPTPVSPELAARMTKLRSWKLQRRPTGYSSPL